MFKKLSLIASLAALAAAIAIYINDDGLRRVTTEREIYLIFSVILSIIFTAWAIAVPHKTLPSWLTAIGLLGQCISAFISFLMIYPAKLFDLNFWFPCLAISIGAAIVSNALSYLQKPKYRQLVLNRYIG